MTATTSLQLPLPFDGLTYPCPACDTTTTWWKAEISGQGIAGFRLIEP